MRRRIPGHSAPGHAVAVETLDAGQPTGRTGGPVTPVVTPGQHIQEVGLRYCKEVFVQVLRKGPQIAAVRRKGIVAQALFEPDLVDVPVDGRGDRTGAGQLMRPAVAGAFRVRASRHTFSLIRAERPERWRR